MAYEKEYEKRRQKRGEWNAKRKIMTMQTHFIGMNASLFRWENIIFALWVECTVESAKAKKLRNIFLILNKMNESLIIFRLCRLIGVLIFTSQSVWEVIYFEIVHCRRKKRRKINEIATEKIMNEWELLDYPYIIVCNVFLELKSNTLMHAMSKLHVISEWAL
jgi:hypothetical protein